MKMLDRMTPRKARILAGYTQEQVAKALTIHRTTYGELEKDPSRMTVSQAIILCKLYGLSLNELLMGEF